MAQAIRVLIVDEDPDSRVATRKSLQRSQLDVAGETGFGTEAVSLASETRPDAILIAIEEPVARPLETAEALANVLPATPVLIYSSLSDAESVRRAMLFGARDYLVKPLQSGQVRDAVYRSLEQEERRQMRRAGQLAALSARGSVISVIGAKGGIGKSVVSVNLALALRRETGKRVLVIDADTQFGDVATMLDLRPAIDAGVLLRHIDTLDRGSIRDYVTPAPVDIEVLASNEDDPWADCTRESWERLIDVAAQVYEFVVVDTSGSFDQFVRGCAETSTLNLLVTSGEVSSIRDTGAAVRRLARWNVSPDRVRLVLNHTGRGSGVSRADIETGIGREVFWELPFDRSVGESVQLGRPVLFSPNSRMAAATVQLARLVAGTRTAIGERPARAPLFKRLLNMRGRDNDAAMAPAPELTDVKR
ncbi:MAG: AAA family ATPase [Hyphomicrobiales bacterium]